MFSGAVVLEPNWFTGAMPGDKPPENKPTFRSCIGPGKFKPRHRQKTGWRVGHETRSRNEPSLGPTNQGALVGMAVLTGIHLRAARALLKWRPEELARKSRVPLESIKRAELLDGPVNMTDESQSALVKALEMNGVTLIWDDRMGLGAALRKPGHRGLIG